MAGKPIVKLYGKRKKDGDASLPEFLDVAAFWLSDDGTRLNGQWSRDIVAIKMKDREGRPYVVTAEQLKAYFCNLRDDREQQQAPRQQRAPKATSPALDAPPDFGDDPDDLHF